jgi:hypothetical protein
MLAATHHAPGPEKRADTEGLPIGGHQLLAFLERTGYLAELEESFEPAPTPDEAVDGLVPVAFRLAGDSTSTKSFTEIADGSTADEVHVEIDVKVRRLLGCQQNVRPRWTWRMWVTPERLFHFSRDNFRQSWVKSRLHSDTLRSFFL